MSYFCSDQQRKSAVEGLPNWNGIDFLHVIDDPKAPANERQTTLLVYFINDIAAGSLTKENVIIEGGERLRNITVTEIEIAPKIVPPGAAPGSSALVLKNVLRVKLAAAGDFSFYELRLIGADKDNRELPPKGIDRPLSSIKFTFKAACAGAFDCADSSPCPTEPVSTPQLNYLARDYASFRQLMLDRLALTTPEWTERNPADTGMALVELLAYVADRLAYEQDAVATEAYLGTARLRSSVRRHARLIDYPMHDGCNARTFVQLRAAADVNSDTGMPVHREYNKQRTQILTRCKGMTQRVLASDTATYRQALGMAPQVFELLHDVTIYPAHNDIHFYTWGASDSCLPKGATQATLLGNLPKLKAGDILILAETKVKSLTSNTMRDANPMHRHAVKLTRVIADKDELGGRFADPPNDLPVAITRIEWHERDALPFALMISCQQNTDYFVDMALAHGNIVAVDHGMTQSSEALPTVPEAIAALAKVSQEPHPPCDQSASTITTPARFRPTLTYWPVSQANPFDPVQLEAACDFLEQSAGKSLACVSLNQVGTSDKWKVKRDLLGSSAIAHDFVVEVEHDGRGYLRFGDGEFGRRPSAGSRFSASYRIGNGTVGNVGASDSIDEATLFHFVSAEPELITNPDKSPIVTLWNPLPARGGVEPESIESVRQRAPSAIRGEIERAVTAADYELLAKRVNNTVQRTTATSRWTGSWRTMYLSVDRYNADDVTPDFKENLIDDLEPYRMAGQDLEVDAPHYVPLQLVIDVCVKSGYDRTHVITALSAVLSNQKLPNGQRGIFHPDNFSFGQKLYLSPIQAAILGVQGVESLVVRRFQRQGQPESDGTMKGYLNFDRREIPRLDNNSNYPDRGTLELNVAGGL
jgi:hypothetical protein